MQKLQKISRTPICKKGVVPSDNLQVKIGQVQTLYLSRISRIISVEKILSCGEISDFCKEFEQLMEFYRNSCRFVNLCGDKSVGENLCGEKMTNLRSVCI